MGKNELRKEFSNKIRDNFIINNPICKYCGERAEHVHHIIPLSLGGDNREDNLISLCSTCHGKIHGKTFITNNKNETWKKLQREGIERAKKEGKYKGRTRKKIDKTLYFHLKKKYYNREINKVQFAKELGISRPTLDRVLSNESHYDLKEI